MQGKPPGEKCQGKSLIRAAAAGSAAHLLLQLVQPGLEELGLLVRGARADTAALRGRATLACAFLALLGEAVQPPRPLAQG